LQTNTIVLILLSMARASLKEKIIESGVKTVHERGFAGSGVREITGAAGVPQGSFTNHFRSKDAFGVAVLDRYHARTQAKMDATLRDPSRRPLERLRAYFDTITEALEAAGWRYGCLVGNMSVEAPEHSDLIREHLVGVCHSLSQSFADTVRAAQAAGEIRDDLDPDELGAFLFSAWEGAMMRMKVDRSPAPIEQFKRIVFAMILPPPRRGRSTPGRR
jgi:TetR/AcrR family transcriptional repressor of nem operon